MSTNIYEVLANTSLEWICCQCGLANFSSSIFSETISESANFYDVLSPNVTTPKIQELSILESTPKSDKSERSKNPHVTKEKGNKNGGKCSRQTRKSVKILVTNFQNIVNKKEALLTMIDSSASDIIIGTEAWLNPSIMNNEIFPPDVYEVERRDRPDGYGGVLVAVKKNLNSKKITASIDSEQVWVKITRKRKSPIIIGSVYRAPKTDLDHFLKLKADTQSIITDHKNAIIWMGGDPNLPDIDWLAKRSDSWSSI